MVRLRGEGVSVNALARRFGVSWSSAWNRLRRASSPATRRGALSAAQVDEVVRLYGEGRTVKELSSLAGVTHGSIYYHLARRGVRLRSPRERGPHGKGLASYLLTTRHSPVVEAALCSLTPGLRKYLDEDDELRRRAGR